MDISFLIRQSGARLPRFADSSAAVGFEDDTALSFAELRERSWRYANGLAALGVRHGDRVSLSLFNSIDYWALYFAITRLGAIVVRVNFRLRGDELAFVLEDSKSSVFIAEPSVLAEVADRRDALGITHYLSSTNTTDSDWYGGIEQIHSEDNSEPLLPRPRDTDPAMIMYTSGTTGTPKGVVWTHGNTTWWTAMQQVEWGFDADSVTMATGPMYHIGALENYVLPTLANGGKVVVFGSTGFRISRALEVATKTGVTDLLLFPSMLQELARMSSDEVAGLHRLRRIFTGGDTVSPSVVEALSTLLPNVELTQVYGLTEGTPIAVSSPPGLAKSRSDLVGVPFPYTEVSIRDDLGDELPAGAEGEIWTRSPAGSIGYWNRPEENARTFIDGWCATGDTGLIDSTYLKFTGRKKDIIRSGGENISPAEVENVLKRHPGILDVAVIGVPHPTLIETVCAVVIPHGDAELDEEAVIRFCGENLAGYKKPRVVKFVDELPRTPSQKVQKFLLRERFSSGKLETNRNS